MSARFISIILMIAASFGTGATAFAQQVEAIEARALIEIVEGGALKFAGEKASPEQIAASLTALKAEGYAGRIYVGAYAGVPQAEVLRVMNLAMDAGFERIVLVAPPASPPAPGG